MHRGKWIEEPLEKVIQPIETVLEQAQTETLQLLFPNSHSHEKKQWGACWTIKWNI